MEMTVVFADLSSFTEMTGRLGATTTYSVVDEFLRLASTTLVSHGALIDKYIGDAVMALFNVPIKRADHVGDCRQAGQGFEFLGYRFEAGQRWVRPKSFKALRERIRQKTQRTRGDSLAKIIEDINPVVRGWFNYFKHAHSVAQLGIDGFVRRRLRAILRKQEKRPGMGKCFHDHLRWPNTFFAAQGLFTITIRTGVCHTPLREFRPTSRVALSAYRGIRLLSTPVLDQRPTDCLCGLKIIEY